MQPGQRQNNPAGQKLHVFEYIEKIKEEVVNLQHEIQSLKNERDKINHERSEVQKCATMNQEICISDLLNMNEIVKNLIAIINQFVPLLPHEQQQSLNTVIDKIKMQYQRIKLPIQPRPHPKIPFPPHNFANFPPIMNPMQLAAMLSLTSQGMTDNSMSCMTPNRNSSNYNNMVPQFLMPHVSKINHEESEELVEKMRKRREPNMNPDESDVPDGRASVETRPSEEMVTNGMRSPLDNDIKNSVNRSYSMSGNPKYPRQMENDMSLRNFCFPYGMFPQNSTAINPEFDLMALGLMPNISQRNEMMGGDYKNMPFFGTKSALYYHIVNGGNPTPVQFTKESGPGIPKSTKLVTILQQSEVVCAMAINSSSNVVYTGGRGKIKGWNIASLSGNKQPIMNFECLNNAYVRSIKLSKDGRTLIVGGEEETVSIFDIGNGSAQKRSDLKSGINACYALAVTNDDKLCYVCCADGMVGVWDLHNSIRIRQFKAHTEGVTCIDISADDSNIWTGGLDSTVCTWDLRQESLVKKNTFPSRVYSLTCSPEWVAVGLENCSIECLNVNKNEKYHMTLHESCVLSIKFAHSYRWMISTGKDNMLNGWVSPMGPNILQIREHASILCSEISSNDDFLIAGCGDNKASIYEIYY